MQLDRTNASLTVRSLPDVIQSAMDQYLSDSLKPIMRDLETIDTTELFRFGFRNEVAAVNRIKTTIQNLTK